MISKKDLDSLIGKNYKDAKSIVVYLGYEVCRLQSNSVYILSLSINTNRVNLICDPETNLVIRASVG